MVNRWPTNRDRTSETGAGASNTPSPMTLSRGDIDADLYSFANPNGGSRRAFWQPGVGMCRSMARVSDGLDSLRRYSDLVSALGSLQAERWVSIGDQESGVGLHS